MADLQSYASRFQARLDELTVEHKVPGATVGIVLGDETLELATGVVNVNTGIQTTTDTLFQIGSITKTYTATLVMQLVDEGKVDLDEPVGSYLPELALSDAESQKTITVRHLLAHTSGMDGDLMEDFGRGDDCIEKYVASFPTLAQMSPPGTFFSYCNSGYVLAGRLIEKIDGVGFDAAMKTRLLTPIGAVRSNTLPEEAILHRVSVGHLLLPGADEPTVYPQWVLPRALGPAGLINAPIGDLLAFAQLHLNGGKATDGTQVLSDDSVRAMQQEQIELKDPYTLGRAWGLGWILYDWGSDAVIGHDGATLGQGGYLRLVPDRKLAVGLLTNGSGGMAVYEKLFAEIFTELAGITIPAKPVPAADQSSIDLSRFEGVYERLGVRMTFEIVEGKLQVAIKGTDAIAESAPATPPMPLDAVDDTTFLAYVAAAGISLAVVFFDFDADGHPGWVHMGGRATKRVG
ncbi:MAG: beta-lactamase family protein [Actinobacteria bacterium]|nr:beta-lactamase family protein [Actinomycetota bacterium]